MKDNLQNVPEEHKPISGWLAFFLWVGIGLGAAASCWNVLSSLFELDPDPLLYLLFLLYLIPLVTVAILCIIAFYKRKTNAVALALTYIAMIALDGVLQIFSAIMFNTHDFAGVIRPFVWSGIWFAYLLCSEQVKELIPKETRTWKRTERVLLYLYIIACIAIGAFSTIGFNSSRLVDSITAEKRHKEQVRNNLEEIIDEVNASLPSPMDNGIVMQKTVLKDNILEYHYQFPEYEKTDFNTGFMPIFSIVQEQEILKSCATLDDREQLNFYSETFGEGYSIRYIYHDKNDDIISFIQISPEDYEQAREADSDFKCSPFSWKMALIIKNHTLPTAYFGEWPLTGVSKDDEYLYYDIAIPEMSEEELAEYSQWSIEFTFRLYLSSFYDLLWTMAEFDNIPVYIRFFYQQAEEPLFKVILKPEDLAG